jgi:hypothetical protein
MSVDFFQTLSRDAKTAGLEFILVGGNAVNSYGYQRTTLDVDLLILDSAESAWRKFWETRGYQCVHATDAFCQFRSADGTERFPVDLMLVTEPTYEKLKRNQQQHEVGGALLNVPDPHHLIAMKLHALSNEARAAQGKDLPDIVGLMRACGIPPDSVEFKEVMERYGNQSIQEEIERRLR